MAKFGLVLFLAAVVAGCAGAGNSVGPTGGSPLAGYGGTWVGSMSEPGGAMMGSGTMGGMMSGQVTWHMTQTGANIQGDMDMSGFRGTGRMAITGTISGQTMTFTMNIPAGGMPDAGCASSGTGTAQMNSSTMTGTYAGSNTCSGAFTNGQITFSRSP